MFNKRDPVSAVFEALKKIDDDFPATMAQASDESPIVFQWSQKRAPYCYIEKMHQFVECWCMINHKINLGATSHAYSKSQPGNRLIDKMGVEVTELDFDNAPVQKIDFVFDISAPFRAKHGDLAEPDH